MAGGSGLSACMRGKIEQGDRHVRPCPWGLCFPTSGVLAAETMWFLNQLWILREIQSVIFHVMKSKFSYGVCVWQGSGFASNSEIIWDSRNDFQIPRVSPRFHRYLIRSPHLRIFFCGEHLLLLLHSVYSMLSKMSWRVVAGGAAQTHRQWNLLSNWLQKHQLFRMTSFVFQ